MSRGGHAEWPVQGSRWQEHRAAHTRGPGAEPKGKLETRAAIEGGQRGTAACAICYSYAPLSGGGDVVLMVRRPDSRHSTTCLRPAMPLGGAIVNLRAAKETPLGRGLGLGDSNVQVAACQLGAAVL
jgi:hypothetical protein